MPAVPASSSSSSRPKRMACAQVESAWLDLPAGIAKTKELIRDAKAQGADILVLPELWLPGYPWYMWNLPYGATIPYTLQYQQAAMAADGPEMDEIKEAARESGIVVSVGFAEKRGASMWMSNAIIDSDGTLVAVKRKWKPTGLERVLFGDASGDTFNGVADTSVGRTGASMCWEHLLGPLKLHNFSRGEAIHCGSWPPIFPHGGMEHYGMSYEGIRAVSSVYAMEGGCFTAMSTGLVSAEGAKKIGLDYALSGGVPPPGTFALPPGGGYAAVYGPDGRKLTEDLPPAQEGFVFAELDPTMIALAKQLLDPTGHYARPDLARLSVFPQELKPVEGGVDAPRPPVKEAVGATKGAEAAPESVPAKSVKGSSVVNGSKVAPEAAAATA